MDDGIAFVPLDFEYERTGSECWASTMGIYVGGEASSTVIEPGETWTHEYAIWTANAETCLPAGTFDITRESRARSERINVRVTIR